MFAVSAASTLGQRLRRVHREDDSPRPRSFFPSLTERTTVCPPARPPPSAPSEGLSPREKKEDMIKTLTEADIRDRCTCPVCFGLITAPILECGNGHAACGTCLERLDACPQCRARIQPTKMERNVALENAASGLKFQCGFDGCQCEVSFDDFLNHGSFCDRRPTSCPLAASGRCCWTGDVRKVEQHLTEAHGAARGRNGQIKVIRHRQKMLHESRRTHALILDVATPNGSSSYVAQIFCRESKIYAHVQSIGEQQDDAVWTLAWYGPGVIKTEYTRKCASPRSPLSSIPTSAYGYAPIDVETTLQLDANDVVQLFDVASKRRDKSPSSVIDERDHLDLPAALAENDEAKHLQHQSKSMWCISFLIQPAPQTSSSSASSLTSVTSSSSSSSSSPEPEQDQSPRSTKSPSETTADNTSGGFLTRLIV